ncbi:hypothetical protein AAFN46_18755 [Pseudomonas sp. CAU 1711]|uniref:hypothetical protein n=1 Tax=Pseudomonas sp. CAU 1711 TaxID=3140356 RepID=UPI0032619FFD
MKPSICALLASFPFILLSSACSAQEVTLQLEALSYEEALQAYHHAGRDEIYRCIHQIANDHYEATATAKPIAIVIDDVLYLKLSGKLIELIQTEADEKSARFASEVTTAQAGYSIIKQFNFSEYRESDDRHVDFWVETPSGKQQLKTFGNRCGI